MSKTKVQVNRQIPVNRQDLVEKIAELGRRERLRNKIENEMNDVVTRTKQRYEEDAEPVNDMVKALTKGIQAYCEVNRVELTDNGKTKTVNLPSGTISWRKCPPSVRLSKPERIIEMLKKKGLGRFVRTKEEVSKDMILAEQAAVTGIKGITIVKEKEELAIEPFEVRLEAI